MVIEFSHYIKNSTKEYQENICLLSQATHKLFLQALKKMDFQL